jgi:hypothetical protein
MLLTEKVISIIGIDSGVPYLEEYLIVSKEITIKESKELSLLVESALTDKLAKLKQVFTKKLVALRALRDEKIGKAGSDNKKIKVIRLWFNQQADKLKTAYKTSVNAAKSSSAKTMNLIKAVPKKGKIGIAAGGALAIGGYAAYRAKRKKIIK